MGNRLDGRKKNDGEAAKPAQVPVKRSVISSRRSNDLMREIINRPPLRHLPSSRCVVGFQITTTRLGLCAS